MAKKKQTHKYLPEVQLLDKRSALANSADALTRNAGTEKLLAETDPERKEMMVGTVWVTPMRP